MDTGSARSASPISAQPHRVPFEDPDFRNIFQKSPVLLSVLDANLTIVASSDSYLEIMGRSPEDLYGLNVYDAFPSDSETTESPLTTDLRQSLEHALRTGKPDWMAVRRHALEQSTDAGDEAEIHYWSPVNAPIYDENGELIYVIQIAHDITPYVEMSESTNDAVTTYATGDTTIESDSIDRTRGLLEENRVLTNAQEAKNEFLSHMSHELRTPLTAISGFAELLTVSGLDNERTAWANTIVKASRHLATLVNEILDISRIESGDLSLSIEPVSIATAIDDALELMRPTAARLDVDLAVSGETHGVSVWADNQRLKQVVINLLSNAIKYNRVGGSVTVQVIPDLEHVSVSITDTGVGLSRSSLEKLFTPFERMDAAATDVEGTGLGLALSKDLVDAMRGRLTAESVVGVGTTFTIELRRVAPEVAIKTESDDGLFDRRSYKHTKNLLYIEDAVANAKLVEKVLVRRPSIRVLPAMLGRLGFELAVDHQPDMILLDLHLPDLNGLDVLALLKSDPKTRNVPVVILSADASGRQYDEVMGAGAREFLTKPIRVNELLATVDRYLDDA